MSTTTTTINGKEVMDLICDLRGKCEENDESIRACTTLSPVEYRAISLLQAEESITATQFSKILNLSPSRVSRVTEKMEANGYLELKKHDKDRRTLVITLSAKGLEAKKSVARESEICYSGIETSLDDAERGQLATLINKILISKMHNN